MKSKMQLTFKSWELSFNNLESIETKLRWCFRSNLVILTGNTYSRVIFHEYRRPILELGGFNNVSLCISFIYTQSLESKTTKEVADVLAVF